MALSNSSDPCATTVAPTSDSRRVTGSAFSAAVISASSRCETFLGTPETARATLAERGTAYVALCADSNEIARFRSAAPAGFAAQLADGQAFGWLEPVRTGSNLQLWRIAG